MTKLENSFTNSEKNILENKNRHRVKYSIITPMYNSFDLMERYFDSLLNQTYKDFEVIIVDDCSTDGSYKKLLDYSEDLPLQIIILKTEKNAGPGNARNKGIKAATGDWITFIDDDDWVVNDFLEKITTVINDNDVDCVIYDYFISKKGENNIISKSVIGANEGDIPTNECIMNVTNHTIGKFYKLNNLINNNIQFPKTRRCEDVAFTTLAVSVSNDIYYLNEPLYYYYQRPDSLSNKTTLDEKDMIQAFGILQTRLEDKYPQEIKEKSIRDLLYGCVLMMCKSGKSNRDIKNYIEKYESQYPDWYKCKMVNMIGVAKKIFLKCIRYRFIFALKILSSIHTRLVTG